MDLHEKLSILADAAKYDASCASSGARRRPSGSGLADVSRVGVCHSFSPDGRCISLLKILLTNHCIYDCKYCVNRASNTTRRAVFTVEEIVTLTIEFYRRNYIEGLFLSSGVLRSPDYTMERMKEVARRLRQEQRFGGYIHLKVVPGAAPELIEAAGRWADRLSANIELPTPEALGQLAPDKRPEQIETAMGRIKQVITQSGTPGDKAARPQPRRSLVSGQSTQMIIGATPTPDRIILQKAADLYTQYDLRRVYYSAYTPIPDPGAGLPARQVPLLREHRLYQADWLVRFYGFQVGELVTGQDDNLSLEQDPKLVWALAHPECFPVDVNTAPKDLLLRVPGLGVRNALRILKIRKYHKLRLADLGKLRVALRRARDFIVAVDHLPPGPAAGRPAGASRRAGAGQGQLELFAAPAAALTGEF